MLDIAGNAVVKTQCQFQAATEAETINMAKGEAGRFEQMLSEYKKDRLKYTEDVTKTRLYLESMEKVMAKVKKLIVNPEENGELNLRLLQK